MRAVSGSLTFRAWRKIESTAVEWTGDGTGLNTLRGVTIMTDIGGSGTLIGTARLGCTTA